MIRRIIIATIALSLITTSAFCQQNYKLEDENISAVVNLDNGALQCLNNRQTGWNIINETSLARTFEMRVKSSTGSSLTISGNKLPQPKIKTCKNNIIFTWSNILGDKESAGIDFEGTITLNDEGLIYGGTVKNNSQNIVEQLKWPTIGDVSAPNNPNKLLYQYVTYSRLNTVELYPGSSYAGSCNLPEASFVLINNGSQGLYLSSKDYKLDEYIRCEYKLLPRVKYASIVGDKLSKQNNQERNQMVLDVSANRMIHTQPNTSTKLVPFVVAPYVGTWHRGADIYKRWRKTWHTKPVYAEWIKKVNSWQQLQINGSESNLNFKYTDIIDYAKECKKYGVKALQLTGWALGGQDNGVPSCNVDPRLGTYDELKRAISESQKIGVNILLFTKFTWIDLTSDHYGQYKDFVAVNESQEPSWHPGYNYSTYTQLLGINTHRFGVLCLSDDTCRKELCREFQKVLDLGANGMVYDENQHHAGYTLCFDKSHTHKIPGFLYRGADLLGADFHRMIECQRPDFMMSGEAPYDIQSQYYITYTRADVDHIPVLRYIDSDVPMACAIVGYNERNKLNMCLMNRYAMSYEPRNFKGSLTETPRQMAYGYQIDELRRRYADYIWNGEFRDKLGATSHGKDIMHTVFIRKNDMKRAAVLINTNLYDYSDAVLTIDDAEIKDLYYATPENPALRKFDGQVKIAPQSAVVVFQR